MTILQILPELNVGGVETGTLDLAKSLVRLGHKAIVVSSGGELAGELESLGAKHYQLAVAKKSIFTMVRSIKPLVEIIRKEKVDVVHARSRVPAWIAYFACRRTHTAFVTTCHGYYGKHPFSHIMGWGKRVIVLSNVIGRHMIEDFGVAHERIRLIPRSVDLERFKYVAPDKKRKEEFNVGIIGRITPLKGHLHFVKAMAKLARSVPKLKVWIVGDAPHSKSNYKEQVQVLTRRLGLWHCTEFLGTQRDVPVIMAHLDLLVLATTTHEAFGRVIIEAQAAGVPVVASRVGGVVDIIDDSKSGLLVPPADPGAIVEAALKIFKDPAFARMISENALKKAREKYNIELMAKSTLDVYRQALGDFKALVIKLTSLGDVILSVPALRAIKNKLGINYRISALINNDCKEVLFNCPYIDELLVADLKNKDKGLSGILKLSSRLRRENFDLLIDLQNNRKSHLLSGLSLILDRYGYDNKKFSFLLNHRIKPQRQAADPLTHQFRILKMLGIELKDQQLELWPSKEDQAYIDDFLNNQWLASNQKIVGININASPRWQSKSWPLGHIARLCDALSAKDIRTILTGTASDIEAANKLAGLLKSSKPVNACGKTTINQLACLIKKCSVYVSADSAPLHVASAVGTPTVALFGPTDYRRHTLPSDSSIVLQQGLLCSPCYKPKCKHKRCMELISPEEVMEAISKLLK